jgi:hypothetical protein
MGRLRHVRKLTATSQRLLAIDPFKRIGLAEVKWPGMGDCDVRITRS